MSLRPHRTNPLYRTNPTGFSVRRSGLDWIIADAANKALPGKRFSSEAAAKSELAKLDGGAVSMAASSAAPPPRAAAPAPAPRPAARQGNVSAPAAPPAVSAPRPASGLTGSSDGDVRVAPDVQNALRIEEIIRSGEPRFVQEGYNQWGHFGIYRDKFIEEAYNPAWDPSMQVRKQLEQITPTERAGKRRRMRKFGLDVVYRPAAWNYELIAQGWAPVEWEITGPPDRIDRFGGEEYAWFSLERALGSRAPPLVPSADMKALKEALREGITIPRDWDGKREAAVDDSNDVMGGRERVYANFYHVLSGGKEMPYILFWVRVSDSDGDRWHYLALVPKSGGPPVAAAGLDRIENQVRVMGGKLKRAEHYAGDAWDAHFMPFLEQVAAGEHTDWDTSRDIINADALVETFTSARTGDPYRRKDFFPLRDQKR